MSIPKYPPEGIISPLKINKDYKHIILWMLYNNDYCSWSDFKSDPISISNATLSKYLAILTDNGFIEKEKKGKYKITPEGRKQYTDLQTKDVLEKTLNYPPKTITHKRNYDDWILWMLYNNHHCKWSNFLEEPLRINPSSLSKNINVLLENGYIEKNNREYQITSAGESEYFNMLKKYDLDRQSILDEESKRVELITDRVSKFFDDYKIDDSEIRYRFLNMVLRLDYTIVENTLSDEVDFNKILLFLSINHPDQYPDYITAKDFALEYDIKLTTLNFFIEKIVEDEIYAIRFFKLKVNDEFTYYIQAEERLEKLLSVIVEDYIRKFTYLSKFKEKNGDQYQTTDINELLDDIANDICSNLINEGLKPAVRNSLPGYIEYLAYKFETEKSLINQSDKIKGIAFRSVFEVIQSFNISETTNTSSTPLDSESYYFLLNRIFYTLDIFYLSKLDFIRLFQFKKAYFPKNSELITALESKFTIGKLTKVNELLTNNLKNLNDIELLILRDLFFTYSGELKESLDLTKEIIEKRPDDYVGYLFQSITYFLMGEFTKALDAVDLGLTMSFDISLICQKAQILINTNHSEAVKLIDAALLDYPNDLYLLRTKFLSFITEKACCLRSIEEPINLINSLIDSNPRNLELLVLKAIFFIVMNKHKEAKNWIKKEVEFNLLKHNPRVDTAAYLVLSYSHLARGKIEKSLDIVNKAKFHYPNHPVSHIITGLVHGFNLVYKFDETKINEKLFQEGFQKAISIEQKPLQLSRYYQLKSYILNETEGLEEALNAINKAIELSPEHFDIYDTKIHLYLTHENMSDKALKLYDNLLKKFPQEDLHLCRTKSFTYSIMGEYLEGVKTLDKGLISYPDSTGLLNIKAILLSNLGRIEEAIEVIEKAIELDPADGNLYDSHGEILMKSGDYESALEKFNEALETEPTGWFIFHTYIKISQCYKKMEILDKADEYYERAKILIEKVLPGKRKILLAQLEESFEELNNS
jgi:tetratricopeptide (TPR) repeat protein